MTDAKRMTHHDETRDAPSAGRLHCSRTQCCKFVSAVLGNHMMHACTLITAGCAELALAVCMPCPNMQLGIIPCQTETSTSKWWSSPRSGCSSALVGYLCHKDAPTARPGCSCAPAIQTCCSGIVSHLRPLVHPVGLPRKQAFLSRWSLGPARGCVLLPMNCRPSMEMGSSRLLSLISTLQKSEERSHVRLAQRNNRARQREEHQCLSTPQHRKLQRGIEKSIRCLHQENKGPAIKKLLHQCFAKF